ncbi:MAG: HAD family hydrolase [Spirochaetaceae bacterium]|nr:MAG: HAD family hydrolase [Spirochaetaceae bacterium]
MAFNAVVFDLDGTLLDTLPDIGEAMNRALQAIGLPALPAEEFRERVGWGARVLVEKSVPETLHCEELIECCLSEFKRQYEAQPASLTAAYDGVYALLDELQGRGIASAIVSNKPHSLTRLVVEQLLGEYRFAYVQGDHPDLPKKPDPTATLRAAAAMKSRPAETVFLGDSGVDMATALAAGMCPVGAAWGFRSQTELRDAGARFIIHRPLELLDMMTETRLAGGAKT